MDFLQSDYAELRMLEPSRYHSDKNLPTVRLLAFYAFAYIHISVLIISK
jgi:hypothetical protein